MKWYEGSQRNVFRSSVQAKLPSVRELSRPLTLLWPQMQRIHVLNSQSHHPCCHPVTIRRSSRALAATWFPRSHHANHTCLSAVHLSPTVESSKCFADVVKYSNTAVATSYKLRPNPCYCSCTAYGWYTNNGWMESKMVHVSHLHLY